MPRNKAAVLYRITWNISPGELFFRGGQKGGVIRGSIRGRGVIISSDFAKTFTFFIQVGISLEDANVIAIWQQRIPALE